MVINYSKTLLDGENKFGQDLISLTPVRNRSWINVVVCGSRYFSDCNFFTQKMDSFLRCIQKDVVLIQGGAKGLDTFVKNYTNAHVVDIITVEAEWEKYGKAAGPIRNKKMAQKGDICLAFIKKPYGSRGTNSMIKEMKKQNKPVYGVYF